MEIKSKIWGCLLSILCCVSAWAQSKTDGYVLSIEDGKVYVDLGASQVSPGSVLNVLDGAGNSVARIIIESVYDKYSSANPASGSSLLGLKEGMSVTSRNISANPQTDHAPDVNSVSDGQLQGQGVPMSVSRGGGVDNRVSVIVPPAQVNDVVGIGHFGGYVADLLMEQLMACPNVRLIDRSLFNTQLDEAELGGSYIDPTTAIEKGKIVGARYAVQVTMQKPDVANVRTGIPLASIMGAIQSGANRNIGAQYMSNMEIARLKASVSLSARVVDIQTGEVMFMTSGTGRAEGDSQIGLEYGALGGAKLNDGADGFKQTVTGKAIQKAFMSVGRDLDTYFSGRATKRVMGSASGFGRFDEKLDRRGMSLYNGINKLSDDDLQSMFYDKKQLYFRYKSAKKQLRWSNFFVGIGSLTTIVAGYFAICNDYDDGDPKNYLGVGCTVAGAAVLATGISMNISAHKKVESIKNEYNNGMYFRAQKFDYSLDLVAAAGGGLGLRLSF